MEEILKNPTAISLAYKEIMDNFTFARDKYEESKTKEVDRDIILNGKEYIIRYNFRTRKSIEKKMNMDPVSYYFAIAEKLAAGINTDEINNLLFIMSLGLTWQLGDKKQSMEIEDLEEILPPDTEELLSIIVKFLEVYAKDYNVYKSLYNLYSYKIKEMEQKILDEQIFDKMSDVEKKLVKALRELYETLKMN